MYSQDTDNEEGMNNPTISLNLSSTAIDFGIDNITDVF